MKDIMNAHEQVTVDQWQFADTFFARLRVEGNVQIRSLFFFFAEGNVQNRVQKCNVVL